MVGGGGRCYRSECAILSWPTGMRQPLVENDGDAQVIEIQVKINGAVDVTCCMTTATPHWRSRFGLGFSRIGTSADGPPNHIPQHFVPHRLLSHLHRLIYMLYMLYML